MGRRRWLLGGGLVVALALVGAWVWSRPTFEGPARSLIDIHGRVVALSGGEAIPGAYVIVNLRGATVDRRGRAGAYGCFAESGVAQADAEGNWRYQVEIVDAEATQILLDPTLRVYAPGWVRAQELKSPYKATPIQASFDTENRIALVPSDNSLEARLGHLDRLTPDNCDFSPAHLAPNGWVALHLAIQAEVWHNWCRAGGAWHQNRSAHEFGRIAMLLARPRYIELSALQRWNDGATGDRSRAALYRIAELIPTYSMGDMDRRPTDGTRAAHWDATIGSKPPVTSEQQAAVCARFDPEHFVYTEEQPSSG